MLQFLLLAANTGPGAQPATLTLQGAVALAVTGAIFVGIQLKRAIPVELLFLSGLVVVTLAGAITPSAAVAGFSSNAVILIGALFAVAAGLRITGALDWIGNVLLGQAATERSAMRRLTLTTLASSVVLNTPLVAMLAPVVIDWCRKRNVSPSRLLLPLSYLTILGGVCTVIGTSTTLVCNAQIAVHSKSRAFSASVAPLLGEIGFTEITWVGAPVACIGVLYLLFVGPRLLPNRSEFMKTLGDRRREYLVEILVQERCPLIGQTIEAAGLRRLPGLFLIEIDRRSQLITPVTPSDVVEAGDRMVFTGIVSTIADLERIPGLVPAVDSSYEFEPAQRIQRQLTEAVLSRTSPVVGRTVREANFRQLYNAAIVAVHRNGERLSNKIGDVRLEPGDTLLLQTRSGFADIHRNSRDFYLVSALDGSSARRHDRAVVAMLLFLVLIAWLTISTVWGDQLPLGNVLGNRPQAIAGIAVVLAMVAARCLTTSQARASLDMQVLITIAAAIGVGGAMSNTGAAAWVAQGIIGGVTALGVSDSALPYVLLIVVYLTAMVLTETITNVAVATIMIPLAIDLAVTGGLNPRPFILAVALASSLSFATPIGYQTNLMVMGPGGYVPRDYLRVGLPLAVLTAATALTLIPLLWPLRIL